MISKKNKSYLLNLILLSFAISPSFLLGDGDRNLFLIGVMGLLPFLSLNYFEFDKKDILLSIFLATIVVFPFLFNPESMRWSTVLYSIMFGLTFITYKQLLRKKHFSPTNYIKFLRLLIFAYFIVLIIQQFCVLTGLPIFNLNNYDLSEPWKLNSLSAEPSHSARIFPLLIYCYININELVNNRKMSINFYLKNDKWILVAFLWTMITMGSATAFIFIIIILLKFLSIRAFFLFIVASTLIISISGSFESKLIQRNKNIISAILTLDENNILKADHSAAMRIVPTMVVAKKVGFNSFNSWFGYGIDFTSSFISDEVPGLPEGSSGGGFFQIWLEYGFISFALFLIFSLSCTYRKGDYFSFIFWFFLVFAYGVNNQIVWLCIILLYTNKYFLKKQIFNNKFNLSKDNIC
jgi:hypothetical protein